MGHYDVAQICRNGHVVAPSAGSSPEFRQDHCTRCGAPTIMTCPDCSTYIRGYYLGAGILSPYSRPSYCFKCGTAYPWTRAGIDAARELADLEESLGADERDQFKADLEAITTDTPQTKVAATRLSMRLKKMGVETARGIRDIVVDIASEAAKRIIFPGS